MKLNPGIFKAYDIRGLYREDMDEKTYYLIGQAIVKELRAKKLAVGHDARPSSLSLYKALIQGIVSTGAKVIALDLVTTPMVYFASHRLKVDGAVAVTASHNPPEWNGLKICRRRAVPVGSDSGLDKIKDEVLQKAKNIENVSLKSESQTKVVEKFDIKPIYYEYFSKFAELGERKFKIVIDCANAMGVLELPIFEKYLKKHFQVIRLYCDLKNAYQGCHEPNPLKTETLRDLQEKVKKEKADLGLAYDGDADRIGFVDEKGEIIPMDLVTALIAEYFLSKPENKGATILYDLRSSRAVKEAIETNGGVAHECRVGHAFIKKQMADEKAIFAGELSGHYYFQANANAEVSTLAALIVLNMMAKENKPVSELVEKLRKYHHSGEINFQVEDKDKILEKLKEKYKDGKLSTLDGIKIEYPHWWFNVRASNTEPLLRLNLEADSQELLQEKKKELAQIIES